MRYIRFSKIVNESIDACSYEKEPEDFSAGS
jgi:hypothetical protein